MEYILTAVDGGTEIMYREWVDGGELGAPEPQSTLERLKQVLEGKEV